MMESFIINVNKETALVDEVYKKVKRIWDLKIKYEKECNVLSMDNAKLQKQINDSKEIIYEKSQEIENLNSQIKDLRMEFDREIRELIITKDRISLEYDKLKTEYDGMRNLIEPSNESSTNSSDYENLNKILSHNRKSQRYIEKDFEPVNREEYKKEGIRELVEQLIVYAENEDKNVAREIKIALNYKMNNGIIAKDVLSKEWEQRLSDLGRDKPKRGNDMNFNKSIETMIAHADNVTVQIKENE